MDEFSLADLVEHLNLIDRKLERITENAVANRTHGLLRSFDQLQINARFDIITERLDDIESRLNVVEHRIDRQH